MPYGERRKVGVNMKGFGQVLYGFITDVQSATSNELGHKPVVSTTGALLPGTVFGANSPKPPRAKKFYGSTTKGYEESYIDTASITSAKEKGWEVKAGSIRLSTLSKFSTQMVVPYRPGSTATSTGTIVVNYAWNMPTFQVDKLTAELTSLGIELLDENNFATACFGINSPKPKRVKKKFGSADASFTATTFVSDAKSDSLPDGWVLVSGKGSGSGTFGI